MDQDPTKKLEALGPMTQETEAANPSAESQQAEQQQADKASQAEQGAKDWGMLMFSIGGLACMVAPELKPLYSEERCLNWGTYAHQVGEKYGWNGPSNMPEIALFACTLSFALPTWLIVRQRLADLKTKEDGSLLAKMGAWWRHRKSGKTSAPAAEKNGSQQ